MEIVKDPGNDHEALLTHMVETYEVSLFRTCYMYLRDKESAEDAVQETFLKAYRALHTFRGDCSEKTWLMRIAVNVCRDMRRSRWMRFVDRRVSLDLFSEPIQEYSDYNSLDLANAIMQLPAKLKEAVLLYFYDFGKNPSKRIRRMRIAKGTACGSLPCLQWRNGCEGF